MGLVGHIIIDRQALRGQQESTHKGRRGINCGRDFKVTSDDMEPAGDKRRRRLDYKDLAPAEARTATDRVGPERQTGGPRDRQTDRQTGAPRDRQSDTKTSGDNVHRRYTKVLKRE